MGIPAVDPDWRKAFEDDFWPTYREMKPTSGKGDALVAWCRIPRPDPEEAFNRLMDALDAYREETADREPKFRKDASVWLNAYHRTLVAEEPV